jgi:transposase
MEKLTPNLTDNKEGFIQEKVDLINYETSFRRWLVVEIESGRMSWQEARSRFKLPYHFDALYKHWQKKYSEDIVLTLPLMSAKDRTNNEELEKRVKDLEKQLELAQMKIVALNTVIDIAEKDYKLEIRKKSGPRQ